MPVMWWRRRRRQCARRSGPLRLPQLPALLQMMGIATKRGLQRWARIMRSAVPPRPVGRPPKYGSRAWLLQRQAALDLPDPRNAGFPHPESVKIAGSGVFSSSTTVETNAVFTTSGTAGSGENRVFSTLLADPHFSCARVVAPHISPTGGNFPLSGSANETQPEQPQKMRAMGPATVSKNQIDCSKGTP